jgi:hypothetical protein
MLPRKSAPQFSAGEILMPVSIARVSLAISLSLVASSMTAAYAQSVPPPVKMGLWQTEVDRTMTGFQLPPGVAEKMRAMGRPAPGNSSTTVESCWTPEQWNKSITDLQDNKSCTRTNVVQDSHHLSFDVTCTDSKNNKNMLGHMEMIFDDSEHVHGTMVMKSSQSAPTSVPIDMDMKLNAHFVSSDCGDVKPGEGKVVSHQ